MRGLMKVKKTNYEVNQKIKEDKKIVSLGTIPKSKRNLLHAEAVHNTSGTGAHKSKTAYKRKTKHNDKLMY